MLQYLWYKVVEERMSSSGCLKNMLQLGLLTIKDIFDD